MTAKNEAGIVAEKPAATLSASGLRVLLVLSSLPLLGVVGAFGIAPQTVTDSIERRQVTVEIALAPTALTTERESVRYWREERIQRGDTVGALLTRLQADDPQALAFLARDRSTRAFHQLVPGRSVKAVVDESGRLQELFYRGDSSWLNIERTEGGFTIAGDTPEFDTRTEMKSGVIESSLFAATDAAGLPDTIATQLADVFSSDIDFHRDLRKGDRFSVVFEMRHANGELTGTGRILAAEFINQGKVLQAVYFEDGTGRGGYYTPDGRNMRKAFLRSPLEFSRVTSGFTTARFHPVLQTWRAHKGIDYGAPTGTRIRATADGFVDFVGTRNGYGNTIMLRHANGVTTLYGHLSRFAPGLRAGQRIAQGDTIGFVGMTGLATGPHVHYEYLVHGVHMDPLRRAPLPGPALTASARMRFDNLARERIAMVELLREVDLAALE
jgi:murein DD-endopeptidase MepM/ murein hydrolase activator NlpD